jgi:hypothetical protein
VVAVAIIGLEPDDYVRALNARERTARELYEAEVALHHARQSGVDRWVGAAADRLHIALGRYEQAVAVLAALRSAHAA